MPIRKALWLIGPHSGGNRGMSLFVFSDLHRAPRVTLFSLFRLQPASSATIVTRRTPSCFEKATGPENTDNDGAEYPAWVTIPATFLVAQY